LPEEPEHDLHVAPNLRQLLSLSLAMAIHAAVANFVLE
jgi:hypothetical protein